MAVLKYLLQNIDVINTSGNINTEVHKICFDSREVMQDSVFVAIRGTRTDGHTYIQSCIENGATAIICESLPENIRGDIAYVLVKDSSRALAHMAENFYDNPSSKLTLIGVTGTNGKTTTVTLLHRLYRGLGLNAGLLSTVHNLINEEIFPATHTTPDPLQLSALLAKMVERGCTHCFMEVSSHAVHQNRVAGLVFRGGAFTNITHDHLDYHISFDEYIKAKKKFFDELPEDAFALVNIDDKRGQIMLQNTRARKYTYALRQPANFKGKIMENSFNGLIMDIDGDEVYLRLIGEFNAYNALGVYAIAMLEGQTDKLKVLSILSTIKAAEGRFDYIISDRYKVAAIVDYAHTPDALKNVLTTINAVRTRQERLITIIGCGGDRDKAKRPLMAEIACKYSDMVVLTSDNPRSEEPDDILKQMQEGVPPASKRHVLTIENRREAIRTAISLAQQGDIILVAGKGHEKFQEIKGIKYPFDDKQILLETLKELER